MQGKTFSLGAHWIHPMSSTPLRDHFINVRNGIIESLTPFPTEREVFDFGEDCRILPGVVNAHTHLELSQIPKPLDSPTVEGRRSMSGWIAALMQVKRGDGFNPEQGIWESSLRSEILSETAALADVFPPIPDFDLTRLPKSPLRFSFYELIAWTAESATAKLADFRCFRANNSGSEQFLGISPHAPQTVCGELLDGAIVLGVPLMMHLAESTEEIELLRHRRGPLLDLMRRADPDYDPDTVLLGDRPRAYLERLAEAERAIIVHGNYLDDDEIMFLARRSDRMSVVYCPRTHAYFGHDPYPLRKMLDAGVCVALGTDSTASSTDLSLMNEMYFVHATHPEVPLEEVFRLGTLNGAIALGIADQFGTLEPGKHAVFSFWTGRPAEHGRCSDPCCGGDHAH